MKKSEMCFVLDNIECFASAKNNPENMSLLDVENYESILISYKDLQEIDWRQTRKKILECIKECEE